MDNQTAKEKIVNKLNKLDVDALFEVLKKLVNDFRDEASYIFNIALDVFKNKTSEEYFIEKMKILDSLI